MIDLRLGDCLDVMRTMPDGCVDAIVTSPPYAMQRATTYGGISEKDYPDWFVSVMGAARRCLRPGGSVFVNIREHRTKKQGMSDYVHRTRLAVRAAGWFEVDELIWIKPNGTPTAPNHLPRRSWERVLWFSQTSLPACDAIDRGRPSHAVSKTINAWGVKCGIGGTGSLTKPTHPRHPNYCIAPVGQDKGTPHPAAFPVAMARWLVAFSGETVCDPFMGSGTTGLACLDLDRNFIGIERDPAYFAIAERRIADARTEAA